MSAFGTDISHQIRRQKSLETFEHGTLTTDETTAAKGGEIQRNLKIGTDLIA